MAIKKFDILIAGVGGQGVILLSKILGDAAIASGINVVSSEIHGMAQRGGSVSSMVRLGGTPGPIIYDGGADAVLSLEPVEAIRSLEKVSQNTAIVMNSKPTIPFTVSIGREAYPTLDEITSRLKNFTEKVVTIDAEGLANAAGMPAAANIVMLGALVKTCAMPIEKDAILESVKKNVPAKYLEQNLKAFEMGYSAA